MIFIFYINLFYFHSPYENEWSEPGISHMDFIHTPLVLFIHTHPSFIQKKFIKTYHQNGQWGMIKGSCGSSKLILPNSELLHLTPIIFWLAINCKKKKCLITLEIQHIDFCKAFDDFYVFVSSRVLKIEHFFLFAIDR